MREISLSEVQAYFNSFAANALSQYLGLVESKKIAFSPKEVNDAIWGTITLSSLEVAILDCPLLQRLRQIRQLGVVHWVYPSAVHTRFEHSLGVLFQVQQLITAINTAAPNPIIAESLTKILRLAALIHDVGHPIFSHVSEKALMNFADYQLLAKTFCREKETENSKLSEIASYFIVTSDIFRAFLSKLFEQVDNPPILTTKAHQNIDEVIRVISQLIIGRPINSEIPLLQDLISGPFDADKLDYLARDTLFCGIPNVVDISRLVQKINVKTVPQNRLPNKIARKIAAGPAQFHLIGLKWSGAQVLDELNLGRTLLFSKVFRHQKVQAVEAMIESTFRILAKTYHLSELIPISYAFCDEEYISAPQAFIRKCLNEQNVKVRSRDPSLWQLFADLRKCLRDRRLFVKCFQIQTKYPGDPREKVDDQIGGLKQFIIDSKNSQKLQSIKTELIENLRAILDIVGLESVTDYNVPLTSDILDYIVVITPPMSTSGSPDIDRALTFGADNSIVPFGESMFNSNAWSSAYEISGASAGNIFCPRDLTTYVLVAIEILLFDRYKVVIPPSALQFGKLDASEISKCKHELLKTDFARRIPFELRPIPSRLTKADVRNIVDQTSRKIAVFQPPIPPEHVLEDLGALEEQVFSWLKQFGSDEMVDLAMSALEKIRVLGRKEIAEAAINFFERNPELVGSVICNFGSPKDSSSIVSYFADDLHDDRFHSGVMSIEEAMQQEGDKPIVFIDDLISSGSQASNLLGEWFDIPELKVELNEARYPLEESQRTFLRKKKTAFLFVAGWQQGVSRLVKAAETAGLNSKVYAHFQDKDIPFLFENCGLDSSDPTVAEFKAFCERVGRALLIDSGSSPDKASRRSLGHGNRAMLLLFPYNVPAQTLTCLREDGLVDGILWRGLLRRRKKQ